ncbi:3-oxoacyl-ACP reductase [Ignicoccus islandicus DSM 13165]|uniref:3-oxoacyl-ACP reductase n=1 Tax=Ignicoccus islandicus DSM 13165 TaxID=940295 RepID=A0A0U3F5S7_9CREN|nr:SDR family oxidoreductase [Ignicoccus islandicus]ALU11432.1 3-oxoacyl-ACP reductase [Ignicoccus islandicus DSM 13165]
MELGLKGKRVLVTASTKGIGFAIAKTFLKEGARVVISSRNPKNVESALRELKNLGEVYGVAADVSSPTQREELVRRAIEALGGIDVFVFNSGGPPTKSFIETELGDWEASYRLLLESAVHLTKLILPQMVERKWGRVVYVTSVAIKMPIEGLVLSNSVRIGIAGLAKTLVKEFKGSGVTFNVVMPGYTLTKRMEEVLRKSAQLHGRTFEEELRELESKIPIGRIGKPEEIANVVVFLASEAASYVNGEAIAVDGGLVPTVF